MDLKEKLAAWRAEGSGPYLSVAATRSRSARLPSRPPEDHCHNSWEAGVPLHNGLPVVEDGCTTPIGQKKWSEQRHRIEAGLREVEAQRAVHNQEA